MKRKAKLFRIEAAIGSDGDFVTIGQLKPNNGLLRGKITVRVDRPCAIIAVPEYEDVPRSERDVCE